MSSGESATGAPSLAAQNAALKDEIAQTERDLAQTERDLAHAQQTAAAADARREKAETASWENAQLLRMLIQGVTDYAIFMLDKDGFVSTWNPGAERIKGYTAEEIIGSPYHRFYCPEDVEAGEPARALATAAREGKYEKEGWRVRKDGRRFWAHIVLDAVYDETGALAGYAKVTRDITDRRQAQIELQAAREALFQAQKMEAVGQLTAGIAHDFNNMLAGVIGALDLLRARLKAERYEDVGRYAEMAVSAAERAAALTARLLAFGRRQPLDIKPVDVNAVAHSIEDLLKRTMGETITVALNCAPNLPRAETDAHQLENAVLNLAINARDAMAAGGVLTLTTSRVEHLSAKWKGAGDGPFVLIEVGDTGSGMTPEVMTKALDPFFTTKPPGQGTGLGLSMVYGFAKQSRGHLLIESEPGRGTQVRLFLPVAAALPDDAEAAPDAPDELGPIGDRIVLVVEDDPHVRALALDVMRELGVKALAAEDGPRALHLVESGTRIDLMLSDIGLAGGMNGRQLAEAVRARRPKLPILFMTGYAAEATRSGFLGPGMDLITKPFTVDALTQHIRLLLGAETPGVSHSAAARRPGS